MAPNVYIGQGRFRLIKRLGGGAFGEVYLVQQVVPAAVLQQQREAAAASSASGSGSDSTATAGPSQSSSAVHSPRTSDDGGIAPIGELFAAKLEPVRSSHQPHLQHEARLYAYMARNTVTVGIPRIKWFGTEGDFNILIMELVGPSLEDIFEHCKHRFKTSTVMMLADQMISRLEFVHTLLYIHRDLKPENFAMGLAKRSHHVYLLDFGLAKKYIKSSDGRHIDFCDGKALTGTARYVSINTHLGIQQSRRDDMESLGFVLLYLARGSLPWQGVKCASKAEKYERIKSMKLSTSPSALCSKLPPCFCDYILYTRGLKFDEQPNYQHCRELFNAQLRTIGVRPYEFSWLSDRPESPAATSSLSNDNQSSQEMSRRGLSHVSEWSSTLDNGPSSARGVIPGAFSPLRRNPQRKRGGAAAGAGGGFTYNNDEELFNT